MKPIDTKTYAAIQRDLTEEERKDFSLTMRLVLAKKRLVSGSHEEVSPDEKVHIQRQMCQLEEIPGFTVGITEKRNNRRKHIIVFFLTLLVSGLIYVAGLSVGLMMMR